MTLHNYQKRIVDRLQDGGNTILAVGMGLGKTASVLHYIEQARPSTCLVVAPKRVAESVWLEEAQKWGLSCADKMCKVTGTPKKRTAALLDAAHPYKIVGRDNLKDLQGWRFDLLVIDELTSFKTCTSGRSRHLLSIEAKQRIGLTGTFLANGAIDIFGQAAAVGLTPAHVYSRGGHHWCKEFNQWRGVYFYDAMQGSGQAFQKWKPLTTIDNILQPFMRNIFTLSSADYLEIPQVSYVQHKIDPTKEERTAYLQLSATCAVSLNGETLAMDEAAKFCKLQTLADGFIYDESGKAHRGGESSKLEAVADFIAGAAGEGERVLLFYAFREEALWIAEKLKERGLRYCSTCDKSFLQKWNDGEVDVLMAHPASAGHGLNLQAGGRICVWSSITYNYEYWAQANARLARQGQTKAVQIHIFTASGTIEEAQLFAVRKKENEDKQFIQLTKR